MTQANLPDDARRTTELVIRRDRRRIRILASVTIAVWVLVALLIPSLFLPMAAKVKQEVDHLIGPGAAAVTPEQIATSMLQMAKAAMIASSFMLVIVLAAELLAAILTVTLVLTVRRVTLRHVSEQLAEISRQLEELRRR